jgi:hypothetical protein
MKKIIKVHRDRVWSIKEENNYQRHLIKIQELLCYASPDLRQLDLTYTFPQITYKTKNQGA